MLWLSVLFLLCPAFAYAAPTAEWPLTQASISGTVAADASGNGNAGTVVNGPLTFGTSGANFNGQQYIDSPLVVTSPVLTVSAWFNASNLGNANPRLVANSHTDIDFKGFQLAFNSGGGSGFFDVGNGTAQGYAGWSQRLVAGTWYNYVGVYDGATVSAYLNGVQVASVPFAGGAIAAGKGPDINVARNPAYAGDYFMGAVSDVRIYEQVLSAAQILALYQAGPPPSPTPVVLSVTGSGTLACAPTTGDVKCVGSAVPGPPGPSGAMARGTPTPGSPCLDGASLFDTNRVSPTSVNIYVCDQTLHWFRLGPFPASVY
jgi:hypothetical protein